MPQVVSRADVLSRPRLMATGTSSGVWFEKTGIQTNPLTCCTLSEGRTWQARSTNSTERGTIPVCRLVEKQLNPSWQADVLPRAAGSAELTHNRARPYAVEWSTGLTLHLAHAFRIRRFVLTDHAAIIVR